MKYHLSSHAKTRMKERNISESFLDTALLEPTKLLYDKRGRLLVKKLYFKHGRPRLLLVVAEIMESELKIITIIDTSKVKKYL